MKKTKTRAWLAGAAVVVASLAGALPLSAQDAPASLAALLAEAESQNPELQAARRAAEAAAARIPQAGALPDPTLGVGLMYLPLSDFSYGSGPMTMTAIGLSEMFPYPGKLGLREAIARRQRDAADWEVERVRQKVRTEVKAAYYQLYLVDRATEITRRNEGLLGNFARLTSAKYGVGSGAQADVLKAQVERTRLEEEVISLRQKHDALTAKLNALLGRPTATALPAPEIPEAVLRIATAPARRTEASFVSASRIVGGETGISDLQIPPVEELQRLALEHNPMIRAHVQRIAAQTKALQLAGKAKLPDFHVSLEYAQRGGVFDDMISAMVSVPLPIFAGRKQNQAVAEERATLADFEAQHSAMVNEVNAEIAAVAADLRRTRDQVVLFTQGILPQADASLTSATAAYQVGRVDFLALLDAQVTLYGHELDYHRLLADFAGNLASLERAVGKEILP